MVEEVNAALKTSTDQMEANYKFRHDILETLSDSLLKQFTKNTKTIEELWEAMVIVYNGEATRSKKFNV